ncbi:MAG: glycosyltransferase family 2 protein [Chloroflexota bacterium]
MTQLTAIILTYNEREHIAACIETLRFADHILAFDSHSTDGTQQLAQDGGAQVIEHTFENYPAQRNAALAAVTGKTEWVLFVDADERVSDELAAEVRRMIASENTAAGYNIPRHNYIFGTLTRHTGWYPDYQMRLLRVGRAHYDPAKLVHEVVVLDDDAPGTLENPLIHYNYKDVVQFGEKQRRYSAYDAEILYQQGVRPKWYTLLSMPVRHFIWRFVTLNGYRDGWHGLYLSLLMARYEFRKYRLLWEMYQTA